MSCVRVGQFLVISGTSDINLQIHGKVFTFEFSDRFGPQFSTIRGKEKPAPPVKSTFWKALYLWIQQGKRMDGPECVWDAIEELDILEQIGPRGFRVIGHKTGVPEWYKAMA
jgi:hypothetical protein